MNEREAHLNQVANDLGSLHNARRELEHQFAAYAGSGRTLAINAKIAVRSPALTVSFLDLIGEALPRLVIADGDLALEYVFRLAGDVLGTPLWRFYLVRESLASAPAGRYGLFSALGDSGKRICDHTNDRFPAIAAQEVCEAILASPVLRPDDAA